MAKKTKFKEAKDNANSNTTTGNDPVVTTTPLVTLPSELCNNTNVTKDVTSNHPDVIDELEKFTILENNIVQPDDYVKFTELANVYNLFNKTELQQLNKDDLICLIGSVIDRLYKSEQHHKEITQSLRDEIMSLNTKISEIENVKKDNPMSINHTESYADLMGNLGVYKSW